MNGREGLIAASLIGLASFSFMIGALFVVGALPEAGLIPGACRTVTDPTSSMATACSQWISAEGAQQAARWGKWQLILNAFGLVGLGATIALTQVSLGVARAANKILSDNAQRELRAYLDFDNLHFLRERRMPPNGKRPVDAAVGVTMFIKNYGSTPAKKVNITTHYAFSRDGFAIIGEFRKERDFHSIAPSDHAHSNEFLELGFDEWLRIERADVKVRCIVRVTYEDVFGNPQTLQCAFENYPSGRLGFIVGSRYAT